MASTYAALLLLALLGPALRARSLEVFGVALVVYAAYQLGVSNERAFPGGHTTPAPGEAGFWACLLLFIFVAGVLAMPRNRP